LTSRVAKKSTAAKGCCFTVEWNGVVTDFSFDGRGAKPSLNSGAITFVSETRPVVPSPEAVTLAEAAGGVTPKKLAADGFKVVLV